MIATQCLPMDAAGLQLAVDLLRAGQTVAFPTETVYGLGADARNPLAVQQIFRAKGRPSDHPLIVHIADDADPRDWVDQWPAAAEALVGAFWPGPLTLILKKHATVPDEVTGGQDTVGLRCPDHPGAQALLQAFGGGLAAPSANRFGRISPTCAQHVLQELSGLIPLVLDGGESPVGIESTIIDLSRGYPVLLRPGDLSLEAIESVLGQRVARPDAQAPRVSGSLEQHYAPERPLELTPALALSDSLAVLSASGRMPVVAIGWSHGFTEAGRRAGLSDVPLAVVSGSTGAVVQGAGLLLTLPDDPHAVAHHLYAALRWADRQPVRLIVAEQSQQTAAWEGVADRLKRASARR